MRIDRFYSLEGDYSPLTRKAFCAGIAAFALAAGYVANDESAPIAPQSPSAMVRPIMSQPAAQPSVAMPGAVQSADDVSLTLKVTTALLEAPEARGLNFNVETVNGVVTIQGMVDSFAQAVRVIRIARATEGVKHVENRLALKSS